MSNQVIELIRNHRSIRKYTDELINDEILIEILNSARQASSHHNIQAYSIIVIKDESKKKDLSNVGGGQQWIIDCPVFLVMCADFYRLNTVCEIHNKNIEIDELENLIIGSIDTALVAQNILLAAESYGLGGVIIGGLRNDTDKVIELLNLPKLTFPLFGICLGYPDEEEIPWLKPRLPQDIVIFEESYKEENTLEGLREYEEITEDYYNRRTKGKVVDGWGKQMSEYISKPRRPELKNKIIMQGFKLR